MPEPVTPDVLQAHAKSCGAAFPNYTLLGADVRPKGTPYEVQCLHCGEKLSMAESILPGLPSA